MKDKIRGVYIIKNLITGQLYVGFSTDIKARFRQHRKLLKKGIHKNPELQKSWNLHGRLYFDFSIKELCPEENATDRESYWIKHYETLNPEKGFNYVVPDGSRCSRDKTPRKRWYSLYVCINVKTKEKKTLTKLEILDQLKIGKNATSEISSYWRGKRGVSKTNRGWIIIKQSDYDETFNYIDYNKRKDEPLENLIKSTNKKNILKRPLFLKHKNTGEEIHMPSIAKAVSELNMVETKIRRCLAKPFGQRTHHGYYIRDFSKEPAPSDYSVHENNRMGLFIT